MTNETHLSSPSAAVIAVPTAVRAIADRLEAAGFETWCVGGAVRDALCGRSNLDWDLATAALPAEVIRLFARTLPIGIEHGTVGVFGHDGRLHEVTTFRADVETDGRHAVVKFGASLDDDLARRDFTVNAMAWSPRHAVLRDPFGGQEDLRGGCIRAVGDPERRMAEDRLRALRAIRFAARFGFTIEAQTWSAIVSSAPRLTRLSMERVLQEWTKTLAQVSAPSGAFLRWRDAGALATLIPALVPVPDVFFLALDHVPVASGTTRPERASLRALTRLAVPFMPLGGAEAKKALLSLRASNHDIAFVSSVAEAWVQFGPELGLLACGGVPDDFPRMRRMISKIGRMRMHATLRCCAAVWAAERGSGLNAPSSPEVGRLARKLLRIAFRDPVALGDLAITGDDLRATGLRPGPAMGRVLSQLLERVLDDPALNTPDRLLALVPALSMEH